MKYGALCQNIKNESILTSVRKIVKFFDRLEDHVRTGLSHYPIVYGILGGVGIVLFWRGVWHTADLFPFMTGPMSLLIGGVILLLTGLFVSFFVGENIILTGLKQEKKLVERTESEVKTERDDLRELKESDEKLRRDVSEIKALLKNKRPQ